MSFTVNLNPQELADLQQDQQRTDRRLLNRLHYLLSDYHDLPPSHDRIRTEVQEFLDYGFNKTILVSPEEGWKLISQKLYKRYRIQFFDEFFPYCDQARDRSERIERDAEQERQKEKMREHVFLMEMQDIADQLASVEEEMEKKRNQQNSPMKRNDNNKNNKPSASAAAGNRETSPSATTEETEQQKQKKDDLAQRQMDLLLDRQREVFAKRNALSNPGAVARSCVIGPVSALDAV